MIMYIVKVILSAILIVIVTEVSKKDNLLGSIVISIPWVSLIAILWIFIESKDAVKVASFSYGIFWMVIPSLLLFILLPVLINHKVNFYVALVTSTAVMTAGYFAMNAVLKKIGIHI